MLEQLSKKILKVTFTKKNGEEREMICTLIPDFLPATSGNSFDNPDITTVFDLEKDNWRCFRNDSIIDIKEAEWPLEKK